MHHKHHVTCMHPIFPLVCHTCTLHHTGAQAGQPLEVNEGQEEEFQQEVPGVEEPEEALPECPNHQPASFEKGKPRTFSLPMFYQISLELLC